MNATEFLGEVKIASPCRVSVRMKLWAAVVVGLLLATFGAEMSHKESYEWGQKKTVSRKWDRALGSVKGWLGLTSQRGIVTTQPVPGMALDLELEAAKAEMLAEVLSLPSTTSVQEDVQPLRDTNADNKRVDDECE